MASSPLQASSFKENCPDNERRLHPDVLDTQRYLPAFVKEIADFEASVSLGQVQHDTEKAWQKLNLIFQIAKNG